MHFLYALQVISEIWQTRWRPRDMHSLRRELARVLACSPSSSHNSRESDLSIKELEQVNVMKRFLEVFSFSRNLMSFNHFSHLDCEVYVDVRLSPGALYRSLGPSSSKLDHWGHCWNRKRLRGGSLLSKMAKAKTSEDSSNEIKRDESSLHYILHKNYHRVPYIRIQSWQKVSAFHGRDQGGPCQGRAVVPELSWRCFQAAERQVFFSVDPNSLQLLSYFYYTSIILILILICMHL